MTLLVIGENRQPKKGILPSDAESKSQTIQALQDDLVAGKGCQKI